MQVNIQKLSNWKSVNQAFDIITLMCLYGGGFLSFFLSSWSRLISFSACSSRNLSAASFKAEKKKKHSLNQFALNIERIHIVNSNQ